MNIQKKRLIDSGIKKKYHKLVLKDFSDTSKQVFPVIRKYLENIEKNFLNGIGLFIHGQGTSGKTVLANIVALYADAYGFSVLFTDLNILTSSRIERSDDLFEKAKSVDFLFIDGIGKGNATASYNINTGHIETLHTLVKEREGNVLPTVITTRLDLEGIDDSSIEHAFGDGVSNVIKIGYKKIQCTSYSDLLDSMESLLEDA